MSRISWDELGDRRFETGLDRGVFYPLVGDGYSDYTPGIAWNGLTGVDEKAPKETLQSFYYDGVKYAMVSGQDDFSASLAAITYPREFEPCVGIEEFAPGVFATKQKSQRFGLCYRTLVGNPLEGLDYGYKLHLIYGAMTLSPQKGYSTLSNTASLTPFVWEIETVPVETPGFKPMAHLVIESRSLSAFKLEAIENVLYGTETTPPRLPLPNEVRDILALGDRLIIVLSDDDISELETWDYQDGDAAISIDDLESYAVDEDGIPNVSDDVRPVIVLEDEDEPLPEYVITGDLILIKSTGQLYYYQGDV